ncbi:ABC transporter substrate-binding protein [Metabacillus sp. GX 13764]|uniref:ABC transporter substrate-binding protein n=1 Tax=Metabacillus kandeliae TaxID=2900151 RepID=UPI001E45C3EA|nr:ABC transporter substrate-binding protein [Metabacillus kandeliae]MCD7034385.1 ABC transporter substrate-binding protein [Metabacillus kandeliae]
MKLLMAILFSTMLVISGCSAGSGSSHLQKVTVMLDWYPNAVHSFLYAAKEKGYFKEQGLDVQFQMPSSTNDPLKLAAAGQVDMALSYQPAILMARDEGIPVQSFAAVVRHPLNYLMVPENSSIRSPKDLEGKSVGYPSSPLDEALIKTMVKTDGGDPDKVKMTDIGFNLIPSMATNKVDSMIGGFINHEKLLLDKQKHPVRVINPTQYGVPDYEELVMAASEKSLKEKPEVYKKMMAAMAKGQEYVEKHPDEGLSILLQNEEESSPLDPQVEKKSLHMLLPMMKEDGKPFGYQEDRSWEDVADWLYESKVTKKKEDGKRAFINVEE